MSNENNNENLQDVTVELPSEWETDPQTMEEIQSHVASEMPTIPLEEAPAPVDATVVIPVELPAQPAEPAPDATQQFTLPELTVEEQPPVEETPEPEGTQYIKIPEEEPVPEAPVPETHDLASHVEVVEKEPEPQPEAEAPTDEKGRPAPKKGYGLLGIPHLISTAVWLALIVIIGVSLGRLLWVCCADLMAFGKPDQEISFVITEDEVRILDDGTKEVDIDAISENMGQAGLIRYPRLFKLFATLTGKDEQLIPGEYTLNSYFDYNAMINVMSYHEKPREIVTVLIPEGYNCAQIFALLEETKVCTAADLEQCAANGNTELGEYWFLTDEIPWGEKYCLEGYLFPDTYEFYTNDDPANVLNKMLQNFDYRFTDKMKADMGVITARYGLSLHQILTIASMVEEEAVGATKTSTEFEGYNIASVYYNRLANWDVPILGCDATVYYAMEDYFGEAGELTAAHLNTDSPYNTRKYAGLPPGPITNPGSYSMYAALAPNDTDYYYYVYDPEQKCHILSKTEAEHNKLVEELGY